MMTMNLLMICTLKCRYCESSTQAVTDDRQTDRQTDHLTDQKLSNMDNASPTLPYKLIVAELLKDFPAFIDWKAHYHLCKSPSLETSKT
jgi:hypothetical protein